MEKKVMKLASPGKRLLAYIIDSVMPGILAIVSIIAFVSLFHASNPMMDPFNYGYGLGVDRGFNINSSVSSVIALLVVIFLYLAFLGVEIYFYTKSKTIGKAIVGIQVVNSNNGEPVSLGYMILREWFAKKAVGSVLWLGYIWILIDDKNRGWHDKIMDTYVVDVKEERYQSE